MKEEGSQIDPPLILNTVKSLSNIYDLWWSLCWGPKYTFGIA